MAGSLRAFIIGEPKSARARPVASIVKTLPECTTGYKLPEPLECLLGKHPAPHTKTAWPIPGMLGFGASPRDKSNMPEFLSEHKIRVLVDMTDQLDGIKQYAKEAATASTLLIRFAVNPKHKINVESFATKCRIIRQSFQYMKQAADSNERQPIAMYVCDSRGGGIAALLVMMIIAQEMLCSIEDAAVFVTRCWAENCNHLGSAIPRMFPESGELKNAVYPIYARLQQQPIAINFDKNANDIFVAHNVKCAAMALWKLLELDQTMIVGTMPFLKSNPIGAVAWLLKTEQVVQEKRAFTKLVDYPDDDDEDNCAYKKRSSRYMDNDDDDFELECS